MAKRIQILTHGGIDKGLLIQIRTWANEVLGRKGLVSAPPYLCITIWKTMEALQDFYRREKEALGVITGDEIDFLATHDAWKGYPRIHICQERLRAIPDAVVQGVIHHEMSHALHHGTQEFYTFRFSRTLQEAGRSCGLDLPLLQQFVYSLSVAIKDWEVVRWLAEIGLGFSQRALVEHLISDTQEERRIWEAVCGSPALTKIALAAFLKTLLPIVAMISIGIVEAPALRTRWNEAYGWLPERERESLFQSAQNTMNHEGKTFQERLEQAALHLIAEPSLSRNGLHI